MSSPDSETGSESPCTSIHCPARATLSRKMRGAQSGELSSDPMGPLRRWSDLADARKPLSTGPRAAAPFVCQGGRVAEQQLDGGIANAGRVVRVGPHVLRPSSPHSGSIHAFLGAVRHAGFEGAPSPVGIDEDGRERLVFIDGEVPVAPYPDWSQSDTALASIARLLRGLHDATRGFDSQGLTWDEEELPKSLSNFRTWRWKTSGSTLPPSWEDALTRPEQEKPL